MCVRQADPLVRLRNVAHVASECHPTTPSVSLPDTVTLCLQDSLRSPCILDTTAESLSAKRRGTRAPPLSSR